MKCPILGNEHLIANTMFKRPHVLLLGAGASRAAFPHGDRHGRRLPVMKDLVDILELKSDLQQFGKADIDSDFEVMFQKIAANANYAQLRKRIEQRVAEYFGNLELTPELTLYDFMVLSMRAKDMIATFNWDPFLWGAAYRVSRFAPVPSVAFLHGNVAVGYCMDDRIKGPVGEPCKKCGSRFPPSRLLYPVVDKDYTADEAIRSEWAHLQDHMRNAYFFTVFGYSAPQTDAAAIELLKSAWGDTQVRNLEQSEIIDIQSEETLERTWAPFLHTHHYGIVDKYSGSYAFRYPRRSCEALWRAVMELKPYKPVGMRRCKRLADLIDWLSPFIEAEHEAGLRTPNVC